MFVCVQRHTHACRVGIGRHLLSIRGVQNGVPLSTVLYVGGLPFGLKRHLLGTAVAFLLALKPS